MTNENSRISFKPRAFLAAFGLAAACLLRAAPAAAFGPMQISSAALTTGADDHATAVARGGGSLYVVGYSSAGSQSKNIWVSRWNESSLTVISSMTLNGTGNGDDAAQGVAVDGAGNVFVMGVSSVAGQGPSLWFGKYNSGLVLLSSATFAIAPYPDPTAQKGLVVGPGSVTAFTEATIGGNRHILLAQVAPSLTFISSATFFNGNDSNIALGATRDASGNFYVTGGVAPAPATSHDIWIGKFNAALVFVASAAVAGGGGNTDQARSAAFGPDGNLYVGGILNNSGPNDDAWLAKYSPSLALLGSASFPSPAAGNAVIDQLVPAPTRLYAAGRVVESAGGTNAWIAEFDYALNLISSRTLTTPGATYDEFLGLAVDTMSNTAFTAGWATSPNPEILVAKYLLPVPPVVVPSLIGAVNSASPQAANPGGRSLARASNGDLYRARLVYYSAQARIFVARSTDNGATWTNTTASPIDNTGCSSGNNNPALAIDGNDRLWVAFLSGDVGNGCSSQKMGVMSAQVPGTTWSSWLKLSGSYPYVGFEGEAKLAVAGDNSVHLVWHGQDMGAPGGYSYGYVVRYSSYTPGTLSWSPYSLLPGGNGTSSEGLRQPTIAIGPDNKLHVASRRCGPSYCNATQFASSFIVYSTKPVNGGNWSPPEVVLDLTGGGLGPDQDAPSLAIDASTGVHLAWAGQDGGQANYQIKYASRGATGWNAFTNIQTIPEAPQRDPSIALSAAGGKFIVWTGSSSIGGSTPFVKFSSSVGGAPWGQWLDVSAGPQQQYYPTLRWAGYFNNGGGLGLTWVDSNGGSASHLFVGDPSVAQPQGFPAGGVAGITPLGYTGVSAGGFTANWGSSLAGGTTYHLQLSTDSFGTINSTHSTTNTSFAFVGLAPSSSYNVRLATSPGGPTFVSLGSVTTPSGGGSAVNFNFFNNGAASIVASANGQNEAGWRVAIDRLSGGGPYVYTIFTSTPGSAAEHNDGHDTAGVVGLVKYGPGGAFISSRTLAIDSDGAMAVDDSGNVYVGEMDKSLGLNSRWITKYSPSLSPLSTVLVSSASKGGFGRLASDGGSLYALIENHNDNSVNIVHYNSALGIIEQTLPYSMLPGDPVRGYAIDGDSNYGYVLISSDSPNAAVHLVKYAFSSFSNHDGDTIVFGATNRDGARLAASGGKVYVGFPTAGGANIVVREYNPAPGSLNYTGTSSTITNTTGPLGKATIDMKSNSGSVYVSGTANSGGGGDYLVERFSAPGLAFISSATYNSPTFLPDQALGMALGDNGDVFVTGVSSDTIANANAATVKLAMGSAAASCGTNVVFPASPSAISTQSITFNWMPDNCPSGTVYSVVLSSNGLATFVSSQTTTSSFATFPGLAQNNAYTASITTTGFAGGVTIGPVSTYSTATLSISGNVGYTGGQNGEIIVEAYTNAASTGAPVASQKLLKSALQSYYLPTGASGTYYLRAFLDLFHTGTFQIFADSGTLGPVTIGVSSRTAQNFTITYDTVAPNAVIGVTASPNAGQIQVTWAAPTSNANGTPLNDLAGYILQRSTGGAFNPFAGSTFSPIPSGSLTFTDFQPFPGVTNSYRVFAVDYGQNLSAPSAPASVGAGAAASGGTISGNISTFTATGSGTYRVRLSSAPGGPFVAESNTSHFVFSGLSTGTYYLKGFRDLNEDGIQDGDEPAGTAGGLNGNPFPIPITGNNSPSMDVTICDRGLLSIGSIAGTLTATGCPALDAGPGRRTNLLSFETGTGEAGSVSTGTPLAISMTRLYNAGTYSDSRLIVIAPSGQIVASNSSPTGADAAFTPVEFGVYVVEPTSNLQNGLGDYTVTMTAGASGDASEGISGNASYAGSQTGPVVVRFFRNSSFSGIPIATAALASAGGAFDQRFLPAGTYTVDAYKDTSGGPFNPAFQAYAQCNAGAPVELGGGSVYPISPTCLLNDPETGTSGTSDLSGVLTYPGGLSGPVRIGLYDDDSFSDQPVRVLSSAFAASTPFSFTSIASGYYVIKSFIDVNSNFVPDAGEPVMTSSSTAFFVDDFESRSDANFALCDRAAITPGAPLTFSMDAKCPAPEHDGSYMKLFTFFGQSGQPVTIEADAVDFTDSYLYLYDPNGNLIAVDDDSGGGLNASLSEFPLPMNGLYTVGAGPYGGDITGQIRLSVSASGGAVGSISGTVDYTGTQGGSFQVAVFNSPVFSSGSFIAGQNLASSRSFMFANLFSGTTYYLGAFKDVNFNNNPDPGEDTGVFGTGGVASPIVLFAGQNVTGASILISPSTTSAANASHVTGSVFYSGARAGALILEFWPGAQFVGSPVATRSIPTGIVDSTATYDVALPGGANYFMRAFMDVNNDFIPNPDEPRGVYAPNGAAAQAFFVPSSSTLTGVNVVIRDPGVSASGVIAGEGSATLSPSTLAPGQPATMQVIYTAGPNGIGVGGRVGFSAPNGFPFPTPGPSFSSVTVRSTATATLALSYGGPSAFVNVTAGSVLAGQQISFEWSNFYVPCAVAVQTVTVSAVQNGGAPPQALFSGSPAVTIGAGAPAFFQPRNPYFSLRQDELSEAQVLEAKDSCGNAVPLVTGSTVSLHSAVWSSVASNFVADADINLASAVDASTSSNLDLFFAAGVSTRPFYVIGTSTGFHNLQLFFDLGFQSTYYYGLSVVPANALTGVSVSSSTTGQKASTATIAASAAGVINSAFLNFSLGDPQVSWRVLFSSVPNRPDSPPTPVWERWGYGQPNPSEVVWDGRYSPWLNGGGRVPNGTYFGRVELGGGGVRNDSLRVTVALPQFSGRAYDSSTFPNPPLSGVQLRIYGPTGYFTAATGADGNYVLPGLGAGSYRVNVARANYVDGAIDMTLNASGAATSFIPRTTGLLISSNATGGLDLFISRSPRLVVVPSLDPSIAAVASDQWGSLQVRPSTSAAQQGSTFYGPMRLKGGTTTFDDGGQWDSGTQQFVERTLLGFNLPVGTYTVVGDLYGYSRSTGAVYVGPEGARLDLTPFVPKAVVTGQVNLASPALFPGLSVGVSALALSTATGSYNLSGGAFIDAGSTYAVYSISGFDPGSYVLRANAQGFSATAPLTVVVAGTMPVTGQNFPNFGSGATIAGTISAAGAPDGSRIFINAWSPGSFNFGSTVAVTTGGSAPYVLPGLDTGSIYQVFANFDGNGAEYDLTVPTGGFPVAVTAPNPAMNFTLTAASGVVSGLIRLSPGSTDFQNVTLSGVTIASLRPNEVGHEFVDISTNLPNFSCGGTFPITPPNAAGYCANNVSSATFVVSGKNTQTVDIRFLHSTTGQSSRHRISIVNGSTFTLTADLSAQTYAITGSLIDQITDPLFNTPDKIVANAPYIKPLNYPLGLSSTTARVVAVRQEIDSYGVAISTVFNPVTSRVGFIVASGTFSIPNVPNGVYLVRTIDLRSCATCAILAPSVGRVVTVANASVSSVTLTVSDGYSVSGTIQLDGGMQDAAVFDVRVINRRQETVRSATVYLGDIGLGQMAPSVDYAFTNLPAGEFYTMVIKGQSLPIKYAGRPIKFPDPALSPNGLQSNLAHQDVLLQRAAYIIGQLRDNVTGERISATNAGLLAPNFAIAATANPWVEGGYVTAASSISARPIEGDGYFRVGPLVPDLSYDLRLAQTTWDPNFLGSGSQNYVPVTVSGIKPTSGEIRDVGTIGLGQGQSVTGVVKSTTTGLTLGNIKVTARPSFGGDSLVVQTFTNSLGRYSLWVSSAVSNQFHLTAAPRDGNQASDGQYYGTVVLSNVNLQTQATADFLLTPLPAVVTGHLVVADAATGGALSYPFGDKRGFPSAAINLQPSGVVPVNPLGDIETATDERGFFTVPGLSSGIYSLHATSLGYAVFNATVQVTGAATFHIFTGSNTATNDLPGGLITLARGATATGRILKSDGSAPNSTEVVGVAAANFGANEFVVGSVETDPVAKTVNAYTISGFKAGVSYSIVLLSGSKGNEVSFPAEGAGIVFTAAESSTTKTINLTYLPTTLDCLGTAKALNPARSRFTVQIDCLKPLRQETAADDDLTQILSVATFTKAGAALTAPNGAGVVNNRVLSSDRRRLTADYTLSASESRFSMRVRASASELDPRTGSNFAIDKVFDFYAGLDAASDGRASNINGGSVGMNPSAQDELLGLDERSRIDLPPGAFGEGSDSLPDASVVAQPTTTVNVSMTKGRDQALAKALSIAAQGFAPAALSVPDVPAAFPGEMWSAMSQYRASAAASTSTVGGANPLSAFYSIFLPAGIRHQLKQRADLTLSYSLAASTATADSAIQVWFYNATLGKFVLENTNRRLDTVNKTVTVSVDHFSTFVVLDQPPVLAIGASFGGDEIAVANFPNPSDCIVHSNIAINSTLFGAGGVHNPFLGTMIRTSIPSGDAAELKFNIYTVAGEKVRTIANGVQTAGKTYYSNWDCKNDGGSTVASGVYIGEAIHGTRRKFFKIAIIKGSGL